MKYALSLAGGGTRGAFQAGVWRALGELGKEITAITGTSIGAVNGAMFAMGIDTSDMWSNISVDDIVDVPSKNSNLLSPVSLVKFARMSAHGGLDTTPFRNLLDSLISEEKLRNSEIKFGLCTYSVSDKKSVELFVDEIPDGKIVDYILASACFPIFKPIKIDGRDYSDGSIRNNLPVNMLIDKGYDTIISVSVRGVGVIRETDNCGVNIIKIKCPSPEVGLMDFDTDAIKRSIESGYYECMKTFGRYAGEHFSIVRDSYYSAIAHYGSELIHGLESAGKMIGLEQYKVYSFEELRDAVLSEYSKHPRLRILADFIAKSSSSNFIREKLDILGDTFSAANSIVYLSKQTTI